ncbi:MAG: hypothetical protein KKB34_16645 [Bacteroidetes bacterium]|nr:hypothetical protein [Bacteroidota bacterium]
MLIQERLVAGLKCIDLENDHIKISILPGLGSKMIELYNKESKTHFLLEPQNEKKTYLKPNYGDDFSSFDTSGFDECFPTIENVIIDTNDEENGNQYLEFPDHGEVWSRPWNYSTLNDSLNLEIDGVKHNYKLEKNISLSGKVVRIKYTLRNFGDDKFRFLWSAHPLLKVYPKAELILPPEVTSVFLNWSSEKSIGEYGDIKKWPITIEDNGIIDLSVVQDKYLGKAVKCFTDKLKYPYGGLYYPEENESIVFYSPSAEIHYVGLWLCYGGWPEKINPGHLTVAVELSNSRTDSLAKSIKNDDCGYLAPGESLSWEMYIEIFSGKVSSSDIFKN